MNQLRISLLQRDIRWEEKETNLRAVRITLEKLSGQTEIAVLPEMFSTGFSMQVERLAESNDGPTLSTLRQWSRELKIAVTGSFIACEKTGTGEKRYFNRGFFITPEGECTCYDKRHLFRMGHEGLHYHPGEKRCIVQYRGWNIALFICYDLRFPVWCRNRENGYDLALFMANWPEQRREAWDILLKARAIENLSYVCGVNRIGTDGNGYRHSGGTAAISYKGEVMAAAGDCSEEAITITLDKDKLNGFREKFPAWKDADTF